MKESDQVVLFTDFEVAECLKRLSASLDEKRWRRWGHEGSKEMPGKVTGHSFSLRSRRYADNLLAPTFFGRLYPQDGRTRIDGYFERPSWTSGLGDLRWIFVLTVVLALLFSVCLADALRGTVKPSSLLGLIAFPIFVAYLTRDIKRAVCETRGELLDFLQKTLLAQVEPQR